MNNFKYNSMINNVYKATYKTLSQVLIKKTIKASPALPLDSLNKTNIDNKIRWDEIVDS